jgi:hypothetical protein
LGTIVEILMDRASGGSERMSGGFELVGEDDAIPGTVATNIEPAEGATLSAVVASFQLRVGPNPAGGPVLIRKRFAVRLGLTPLVFCQPQTRANSVEDAEGFADQFAIQVVQVTRETLTVKVQRIDGGAPGWANNLVVNVFAIFPQ